MGYRIYFKSSEYMSRQWILRTRSKFYVTNWLKNLQILFTFWKRYSNQIVHVVLCYLSNLWGSTIFLSVFKYYLVVLSINWFLVTLFIVIFSVGVASKSWGKWHALVWIKGSRNLRLNVENSCSGQCICRFFK